MSCCSIMKVMITIAIVGVVVIVVGAVLGFAVFTNLVDDQLAESVRLKQGTEQYERWEQLPFPLTFKVYVFNVTNADDILKKKAKPIVNEVGPYVYMQHRKKRNIFYNESTDTLSYQQYVMFEFDAVASFPLTEENKLTVLNVPLQGLLQTAEQKGLTSSAEGAYKNIFPDGGSFFHTISVGTFLFGGYKFCDPKDIESLAPIAEKFAARVLCMTVRSSVDGSNTLTVDEDKVVHFSFFNHKNNNNDGDYVINAGNEDIHQVGAILSWKDSDRITTWDDSVSENSKCNVVRGRDSSIYPPFNNETSEFDIFNTDICRIVQLKTTSSATYKGIEGNVATLDIDNFYNRDDRECYCINQTRTLNGNVECLPDGFADLNACVGAPVVATFPHLLGVTDKEYLDSVEGLTPDDTKHQTFVNVEPGTGTPLQGGKRLQFNMFLRPIEGIAASQDLPRAVIPILWVEEGVALTDDLVKKLNADYLDMLVALDAVTWVLIGVGIVLVVAGLGYIVFAKIC